MAKQRANLTTIGQFLCDTQQPYIAAPLIAAPFSSITDLSGAVRRIPDPSQSLRPALGIERVMCRALLLKQDETTSSGQQVWELESKDSRVRFVGSGWTNTANINGTAPVTGTINDYIEVTFYGTGLNIFFLNGGDLDLRVTVDGGAEGTDIASANSGVLTNRNYSPNQILTAATGLSLGVHTVRVRLATALNWHCYGIEVLNTSSSNIIIPKGSVIAAGENATIAAQTSTAFNSGFDGNPTLNGRGGRVVVYATPEGRIGKVIQQVDASQLNLSSANHANEEVIRTINFREFGANRVDDFSTMSGATGSNRAFTLEDGTTTLVCSGAASNPSSQSDRITGVTSGGYYQITFIGTGLDILRGDDGNTTIDSHTISVNGSSIGTFSGTASTNFRIQKIVSGLPYGTHTVRITRNAATNFGVGALNFIIYGPKKPAIPDNAVQIAEYNLMANFAANNTAGVQNISTGVLRKSCLRELIYAGPGTWSVSAVDPTLSIHGSLVLSNSVAGNYCEYTFYGTGFDFRLEIASVVSSTINVTLNGAALTTANYPTASFSTYGTGSGYNSATGVLDMNDAATIRASGFVCSGLPLGRYTIRLTTGNAAQLNVNGIDIITPIHFPANKVGSMSIGDLDLINKTAQKPVLDLSKAKAWVTYDMLNQRILSSYNVAAILRANTGRGTVYFEKPFKTSNFTAVGQTIKDDAVDNSDLIFTFGARGSTNRQSTSSINFTTARFSSINTYADSICYMVFFGELEGE